MKNDPTPGEALLLEFQERFKQEGLPRILKATLPFYYIHKDKVKRDRSGVLLSVAGDYYVLMASHGLEKLLDNNIPLYVGWDEQEQLPIPVIPEPCVYLTEANCRDIAIFPLQKSMAKKMLGHNEPISLRDIDLTPNRKPGFFLTSGFPQEWTSFSPEEIEAMPLHNLGRFYEGDLDCDSDFEYVENVHCAIQFSRNAIRTDDLESEQLPSFAGIQGISGCGIWRVSDYNASSFKSWKPSQLKLIALQHRYYEQSAYVLGTWVRHVLDRLVLEKPSVRKAMEIIYPS